MEKKYCAIFHVSQNYFFAQKVERLILALKLLVKTIVLGGGGEGPQLKFCTG